MATITYNAPAPLAYQTQETDGTVTKKTSLYWASYKKRLKGSETEKVERILEKSKSSLLTDFEEFTQGSNLVFSENLKESLVAGKSPKKKKASKANTDLTGYRGHFSDTYKAMKITEKLIKTAASFPAGKIQSLFVQSTLPVYVTYLNIMEATMHAMSTEGNFDRESLSKLVSFEASKTELTPEEEAEYSDLKNEYLQSWDSVEYMSSILIRNAVVLAFKPGVIKAMSLACGPSGQPDETSRDIIPFLKTTSVADLTVTDYKRAKAGIESLLGVSIVGSDTDWAQHYLGSSKKHWMVAMVVPLATSHYYGARDALSKMSWILAEEKENV